MSRPNSARAVRKRAYMRADRIVNPEKYRARDRARPPARAAYMRAYIREYYRTHKVEIVVKHKEYAAAHRETLRAKVLVWKRADRAARPEKYRAAERARYQRTKPLRRGHWNERAMARYARKTTATPPWADRDALRRVYQLCPPGHQVDHIIPLRGKLVSGLHVLENLQYLTARDNITKGNRYGVNG